MIIKCNDDLFTDNDEATGLYINTDNVTSYVIKRVPCSTDCVLRVMLTNGGSRLIAKGAKQYLVNLMEKIANSEAKFMDLGD